MKSLPQWGRASKGSRTLSISGSAIDFTSTCASFQVKWNPTLPSPTKSLLCGLINKSSAAMARISEDRNHCRKIPEMPAIAQRALAAKRRGTKYSDCNSSPEFGTRSILKCGSRRCQGPGVSCSVQALGSWPFDGCCCSLHSWHRSSTLGKEVDSVEVSTCSFSHTENSMSSPLPAHVVQRLTE